MMLAMGTPDAPPVLVDVDDAGVATLSLNRGDRLNLFDVAMRDAFIEALLFVRDHPDARVLLLRAEGRHFSAGADLAEFGELPPVEARRVRWDRDPWGLLWELRQPSIVALHGHAVGAGLEMAMLCDVRLASTDTRLGLPETRLGMLPAAGGTQTLTRLVGPAAAYPLVVTAETLDAPTALDRGIVHRVVEDVEADARAVAEQLADLDPAVATAARRALHAAGDLDLDRGLAVERRLAEVLRRGRGAPPGGLS
jgi:enoyl-CoA hydratase/carnithine racemase